MGFPGGGGSGFCRLEEPDGREGRERAPENTRLGKVSCCQPWAGELGRGCWKPEVSLAPPGPAPPCRSGLWCAHSRCSHKVTKGGQSLGAKGPGGNPGPRGLHEGQRPVRSRPPGQRTCHTWAGSLTVGRRALRAQSSRALPELRGEGSSLCSLLGS